ncbi:MAG: ACT domain-containing protein, partial [Nitrosopumilaceae archaeon]
MKKIIIGVTVVGKDREGIVATFTNFVFHKGGNIEKVNQNVMKGLFGMYLEVSFTKSINIKKFDSVLQKLAKKQGMEVSIHHELSAQKKIA